ncbi:MAG: hypothetical protein V4592_23865 [Bacteroidota bacterium]
MKRLLYGLLITSICQSCIFKTDKRSEMILDSIGKANAKNDSIIKHFRPIIQGVWDNEGFIDKVTSRSLLPIDSLNPYIVAMNIETDRIIGDKLVVGVGYSDRRGENITFKFQNGKRRNSLVTDTKYELAYSIIKSDTVLYLFYDEQGKTKALKFRKTLNYFPRF